jgi:hypothetical protein
MSFCRAYLGRRRKVGEHYNVYNIHAQPGQTSLYDIITEPYNLKPNGPNAARSSASEKKSSAARGAMGNFYPIIP